MAFERRQMPVSECASAIHREDSSPVLELLTAPATECFEVTLHKALGDAAPSALAKPEPSDRAS
jgi:hypothetical protein